MVRCVNNNNNSNNNNDDDDDGDEAHTDALRGSRDQSELVLCEAMKGSQSTS